MHSVCPCVLFNDILLWCSDIDLNGLQQKYVINNMMTEPLWRIEAMCVVIVSSECFIQCDKIHVFSLILAPYSNVIIHSSCVPCVSAEQDASDSVIKMFVLTTLYFQRTHLTIHREESQIHAAHWRHSQSENSIERHRVDCILERFAPIAIRKHGKREHWIV